MNKNLKKEKRFYKITSKVVRFFINSTNLMSILSLSSSKRREGEKEMQLKKATFVLSFALSALLAVGTTGFADGSDSDDTGHMMNASEKGMTNMMENGNMSHMMNTMNSPEAQEMVSTCASFMENASGSKENE